MKSELLIYQQNVIDTYLYFIRENLNLIEDIYDEYNRLFEPYNPYKKCKFYISRAKHLQTMTLIGLTAEHLVKIILLNRGYVLNTGNFEAKFNSDFMQNLREFNEKITKGRQIPDQKYPEAENNINISFKTNLKDFGACIALFLKSNPEEYYKNVGTYVLNPSPKIYDGDEYLGFKEIKPEECLKVIQKMRNSYLHLAEAKQEQNGVVWYLFNFLVWLCKKEYPDFFKDKNYIGNDENKSLFGYEQIKTKFR